MENQEYEHQVEKIIESKSFGRSDTYANLLRYLVQCTLEKDVPKETTIASEIFGKSSFDPSQSTLIRVYIYNLRKKLKTYYANEGLEDTVVLQIPKGSYEVSFAAPKTSAYTKTAVRKKWIIPLVSAALGLVVVIGFFVNIQSNQDGVAFKAGLWKDLFESEKTTMLVLGDLFAYTEIDSATGLVRNIRDPRINSPQEFTNFKSMDKRNGITFESITYTYQIRNSMLWVKDLGEVFYKANDDFIIRSMSRFNPKELSDNNLIVVGMIKTLGIFRDYFQRIGYTFEPLTDTLSYNEVAQGEEVTFRPSGSADGYHTDYAVVAKLPGPNNNFIYLFGGIWDTGTSQGLKNFTDPKLMQELERLLLNKFGEIPKYYKILFEVSGVDRTELNSQILAIQKIEIANETLRGN